MATVSSPLSSPLLPLESEEDASLIALTSHFAQVQFRLKQITASPSEKRESMLEELETFAFQGCPIKITKPTEQGDSSPGSQLTNILEQLHSQMIQETTPTNGTTPTDERESIILDELKKRFHSQFNDLDGLTEEQVREKVDELVLTKEHGKDERVQQLASQVRVMEVHINHLQHELATVTSSPHPPLSHPPFSRSVNDDSVSYEVSWCQHSSNDDLVSLHRISSEESLVGPSSFTNKGHPMKSGDRALQRTLAIMQLLTLWQCGGIFNCLPKTSSELTGKSSVQFPSAVRSLELAVDKISIISMALSQHGQDINTRVRLECNLHDEVSMNLSDSLRELLENGWEGLGLTTPTSCLTPLNWMRKGKLEGDGRDCLAWHVLLHYYNLKKGSKVCDKPQNKLSSSFGLPLDSSTPAKRTILSVIHRTEKAFVGCRKYSPDLKFRAFICQGFNLHHLSDWIKLLVHHPTLIDDIYKPSSFITTTKFRSVIQCLDRLSCVPHVAPVELPPSFYHHTNSY